MSYAPWTPCILFFFQMQEKYMIKRIMYATNNFLILVFFACLSSFVLQYLFHFSLLKQDPNIS